MKEIPLTKGMVAFVDDEDYELVSQYKWTATCNPDGRPGKDSIKKWYAIGNPIVNGKRVRRYLHRFLMNTHYKQVVDHLDGNGLKCTRKNMENVSRSVNNQRARRQSNDDSW